MPRFARLHAPGALVHVISRFVNREFRLGGPRERAAVLLRLAAALERCDWTLLAYALMSSHIHLALIAGEDPPWRLLKPWHTSVAKYLNRSVGALGPVFAERATTVVMGLDRVAVLAAYLHNNPVRAGVVTEAGASDWTSHQAWVDLAEAPPWLNVERGLALAGFDTSATGRAGFAQQVAARRLGPRDPELTGAGGSLARRQARATLAAPVELGSPACLERGGCQHVILRQPGGVAPMRWQGELIEVVRRAAVAAEVTVEELCSRSHRPACVRGRRIALVAGVWLLRREAREVAAALGICGPSASRLLRGGNAVMKEAIAIADELRWQGAADDAWGGERLLR